MFRSSFRGHLDDTIEASVAVKEFMEGMRGPSSVQAMVVAVWTNAAAPEPHAVVLRGRMTAHILPLISIVDGGSVTFTNRRV